MENKIHELETTAVKIKRNLLNLCSKQVIHIGGDLSVADIMTVLWTYKMHYNPRNVHDENRDRFVLSKGHASAVMSFCQAEIGCFSAEEIIDEYATDQGRFSMHSCNLVNPYVEVSTGSLGHGFPVACGMAMGLRLKANNSSRVYVVMGDGEQAEGSIWEAAMNAVKYKLGNLIAIVDNNGFSADGALDELTSLGDISAKYQAFGWNVLNIDGHSISEIKSAMDNLPSPESDIPTVIVCHTTKGKGVRFMENQARWHAGKISQEELKECISNL